MTEREQKQYEGAVGNLKTRIGENYLGKNVSSHLKSLERFYCGECTRETREGILCFLEALQTERDFACFLNAQGELQKVKGRMGTGFSLCRKNPWIILYLLQRTEELRQIFQEQAYQALSLLLGMGTRFELDENYGADIQSKFYTLFEQKYRNYLRSFEQIREELAAFTGETQLKLSPTSGDLHCGGKNPYCFTWKGKQYVYKPRDMRVDALLNDALILFNELLPGELKLPAAEITMLGNKEHTGYMEYAAYAGAMDEQHASSYYQKFGALLYFCKIHGVSDLHYENIIATESGPVLIDGECAFQKKVIMSKSMNDMNLDVFKRAFLPVLNTENQVNFEVIDDKTGAKRKLRFGDPLIRENIRKGFQTAAACGKQGKERIGKKYAEILETEYLTRVVPVQTGDFYSKMEFCCRESARRGEMICYTAEEIRKFLERIFQRAVMGEEPGQIEKALTQILERDFFQGDVPLFQARNQSGKVTELYADGSLLFPVTESGLKINELVAILKNEIEWWTMEEAKGKVEELF